MHTTQLPRDRRERPYNPIAYPLGYNVEGLHPCINEAHQVVQWWLNDIINSQLDRRRWITLYGKSGTGKTHLAKAAMATIRNSGRRVIFRRWGNALDSMLNGHWELLGEMMRTPVLILDDIGMEYSGSAKTRGISAAKLGELLDERIGRWTMLTSNLAPGALAEALGDGRVTSRMYRGGSELVSMTEGEDFCKTTYYAAGTHAEREKARASSAAALPCPPKKTKPVPQGELCTTEEARIFFAELRAMTGKEAGNE